MIFVTTGQRIAVENFSKGAIYKVTFTDESISYMMCVGIGKDFVMLQSTDPLLFSLTMQSASRVSTIDVHDPTPPEPPTPIENALQYQTGEPPFTFITTENSLFSWYIEGEAGVKTANLLNVSMQNIVFYNDYPESVYDNFTINNNVVTLEANKAALFAMPAKVEENTLYYVRAKSLSGGSFIFRIRYYTNLPNNRNDNFISTAVNMNLDSTYTNSFTTPENCKYMLFEIYHDHTVGEQQVGEFMINAISNNYEPFGYKISIYTNEHTTTIYLDEPIAEGEKLYSVNVDAQIVTDIGENTLSVSDPQPPEMQIVYGIYAEA